MTSSRDIQQDRREIRRVVEAYRRAYRAEDMGRCWDLWCRQDQTRRSREMNSAVYEATPVGDETGTVMPAPEPVSETIELQGDEAIVRTRTAQPRFRDVAALLRDLEQAQPPASPAVQRARIAELPRIETEERMYLRYEEGHWRIYRGIGEPPHEEDFKDRLRRLECMLVAEPGTSPSSCWTSRWAHDRVPILLERAWLVSPSVWSEGVVADSLFGPCVELVLVDGGAEREELDRRISVSAGRELAIILNGAVVATGMLPEAIGDDGAVLRVFLADESLATEGLERALCKVGWLD